MSKRLEEVIETVRVNQWFEKEYIIIFMIFL
jgi:hypothetical protein